MMNALIFPILLLLVKYWLKFYSVHYETRRIFHIHRNRIYKSIFRKVRCSKTQRVTPNSTNFSSIFLLQSFKKQKLFFERYSKKPLTIIPRKFYYLIQNNPFHTILLHPTVIFPWQKFARYFAALKKCLLKIFSITSVIQKLIKTDMNQHNNIPSNKIIMASQCHHTLQACNPRLLIKNLAESYALLLSGILPA